MAFDECIYTILVLRYKELFGVDGGDGDGGGADDVPFDLEGYLTEIDTDVIDADYMNTRFEKYLKLITLDGSSKEQIEQALDDLHRTFAALTQEEQKYAGIFLHDVQRGDIEVEGGKTLRDYITEYQYKAKDDQIHQLAVLFGLNEGKLRGIMELKVTEANINEFGRFDELKDSVDKAKAKAYFEKIEKDSIPLFKINMKTDQLLRKFIIDGGFDINP